MQLLFLWDAHGAKDPEMGEQSARGAVDDPAIIARAMELAGAAWELREATDQWVERLAPQWPPRRQPGVDRALIRLAIWELTHADTPPKVVIDEAIELAKQFSTELSSAFVNGVLDAALKEHVARKELPVPTEIPPAEIPPPEA